MHTIASIARPAGGAAERSAGFLRRLRTWLERSRQRHALRGLDDAMLKDIGLSRADIELESAKPFWRD